MTTRPLRNRVDPWGQLNGVPDKVALRMGNRGRLHNEEQEIVRDFTSKRWITCCLERKGTEPRKGKVFGDGYSELFFLDEATAFRRVTVRALIASPAGTRSSSRRGSGPTRMPCPRTVVPSMTSMRTSMANA